MVLGNSPGNQIPPPGVVPNSPIHRGYPPGQQDPLQRLQHVGPQDPYAQPPATPRQMEGRPGIDPYAQPPPTPRSAEHFGATGARPQSLVAGGMGQRDPFSASATDPFEQSPTGRRSGGPPGTPQQSPSQPHWPGAAQESDPYAQSPVKQGPDGMQSPSGVSSKIGEGFPQPMIRPPGMTRPQFMRQASQGDPYAKMPPTPVSSQPDDPYAFQPSTPRPVSEGYRPPGPRMPMPPGQMIRPPRTSVPQSPDMRPQFMHQMSASGMPQVPHEGYMQRPPFRPPVSQHMVRPPGFDPYSQPPGTPIPGMDPSREPAVVCTSKSICMNNMYVTMVVFYLFCEF